jgi:hypothetical protein
MSRTLIELLMSPLPWEWKRDGTGESYAYATFHTGKKRYEVSFCGIVSHVTNIQFRSEDGQGITGTGFAFAVFSTILAIIRDFILRHTTA